jgi:hypothetical protein
MPTPAASRLDYSALPLAWHRRRKVRLLLLLAALGAVLFTTWRWGPRLLMRVRINYWQHECLSYTAPADQVVYEDAISAPALIWEDSRPVGNGPSIESTCPNVMARSIRCWDKLCRITGRGATPAEGVLFLHRRNDPSGKPWLVAVQFDNRSWNSLSFSGLAVLRADDPSADIGFGGTHFVGAKFIGGEQPVEKLKIYAGQPDPSDPTRFTIPLELGKRKGTLVGTVIEAGGVDLILTLDPDDAE